MEKLTTLKKALFTKENFLLVLILLLAAFVRLYKIKEFAVFLGDEGRDALTVKRMIVDHEFTLLGPTASVGGFYLGPIYYYFMIPFLWLFGFDPIGPAVMVALFSLASVWLLYQLVKNWFGTQTALAVALLYAVANNVVASARSSWNPNIMPFFALFSLFSLHRGILKEKFKFVIIAGICCGIAIQSHYLGLILGPILLVSTLLLAKRKFWLKCFSFLGLGFFIGASPFLAFEMRHGFPNSKTIFEFVTRFGATTGPRSLNFSWLLADLTRRTFEAVFHPLNPQLINLLFYFSALGLLYALSLVVFKKKRISPSLKLILAYCLVGIFGLGSYKGNLFFHYFGFLFPLPFFLLALALKPLFASRLKSLGWLVIVTLVVINLKTLPIWARGSNLIKQTERITQEAIKLTNDQDFNFALIAEGNSDHAYRYFLEILNYRPKTLEEEITTQLIVICELAEDRCHPLGHPLWEIAGFGRAEIVEKKVVFPHISLFKLIHHPDSIDKIGQPAQKG